MILTDFAGFAFLNHARVTCTYQTPTGCCVLPNFVLYGISKC